MDVLERLRGLLDERGWTEYRLAKECGLSESTIANIFRRNSVPSITTLESICNGFGITLSQFFADGDMVELTPQAKELFDNWVTNEKSPARPVHSSWCASPAGPLFRHEITFPYSFVSVSAFFLADFTLL